MPELAVGAAFADFAGLNDPVFDVNVTPNRQDCMGVRGIARDLAAAGVVWQELLLVILGQRVTSEEAIRSWRRIVVAWGEPAPGPVAVGGAPSGGRARLTRAPPPG